MARGIAGHGGCPRVSGAVPGFRARRRATTTLPGRARPPLSGRGFGRLPGGGSDAVGDGGRSLRKARCRGLSWFCRMPAPRAGTRATAGRVTIGEARSGPDPWGRTECPCRSPRWPQARNARPCRARIAAGRVTSDEATSRANPRGGPECRRRSLRWLQTCDVCPRRCPRNGGARHHWRGAFRAGPMGPDGMPVPFTPMAAGEKPAAVPAPGARTASPCVGLRGGVRLAFVEVRATLCHGRCERPGALQAARRSLLSQNASLVSSPYPRRHSPRRRG